MKRILVVSSGRADASPLRPVVEALGDMVCASPDLGEAAPYQAVSIIEDDIESFEPDVMLVLGDRFEILGACLAATHARIPIAHIHGGEASFGSFDNQIRDAITKLAHIHFVAAEPMRERLLALGEEPHRIHVTGAPGLDNLVTTMNMPRKRGNFFLVTYHPPTLSQPNVGALIAALRRFSSSYGVALSKSNNDPGGAEIDRIFFDAGFREVKHEYIHSMRNCAVVVGNSSSGIIEAPYLEVPTVNIGPRQDGRLKGRSIIDCPEDADAIEQAILKALKYDGPYDRLYGEPGGSQKIADILKDWQPDMVKRWPS